MQTFYNGLDGNLKLNIDAAAGGALMAKSVDYAYELLKNMVGNNYQWPTERSMDKNVTRIHEVDAITTLTAQVAALSKKFDSMGINANQSLFVTCELCGGDHSSERYYIAIESVQYVSNYNRQANNPNSNFYNMG